MIKASKIIHRGQERIKVDFPYNQSFIALLRQIEDAKWSKTHRAWHIPYKKEAYGKLKSLFPDILVENLAEEDNQDAIQSKNHTPNTTMESIAVNLPTASSVLIEVIGRKIMLKLPKNDTDTKFILTLRFSRWDKNQRVWIVPNYPGNLDIIKEYFKNRISNINIHEEIEAQTTQTTYRIAAKEVLVVKTPARRLKIIFGYNKTLAKAIKEMPFWSWDAKNKWWTIPFSDKLFEKIKEVCQAEGLDLKYVEEHSDTAKVARKTESEVVNYRYCPEAMLLKLNAIAKIQSRLTKAFLRSLSITILLLR